MFFNLPYIVFQISQIRGVVLLNRYINAVGIVGIKVLLGERSPVQTINYVRDYSAEPPGITFINNGEKFPALGTPPGSIRFGS